MAQIAYKPEFVSKRKAEADPQTMKEWARQWSARLIIGLFLAELLVPALIYFGAPGALDFVLELIAAGILVVALLYMLARNHFPAPFWIILAATLIWAMVAIFEGQSTAATAWGWWKFFKYPLIGIYAYMAVRWPPNFARWLPRFLVAVMAFQVAFQLLQYALGEPAGDSLAGTFGIKGVGPQTMFNLFVIALAFGHWTITRQWKLLILALALGFVSSMLNVTKVYIPFVVMMGVVTIILHLIRGGQFRQLAVYIFVFAALAVAAVPIFNNFIASARGLQTLQEYLQPENIDRYLYTDGAGDDDGKYNLGRGLSVTYAWQLLQRDMTTTLFGMGLGSRSSSTGLGIEGVGLETDLYGGAGGTGLLILLQEMGLVGIVGFVAFTLWMVVAWARDARRYDDTDLKVLQFGLILYTLLWLVWLWYQKPWTFGVLMSTYWLTVGYVFNRMRQHRRTLTPKLSRRELRMQQRRQSWRTVDVEPASQPPSLNGHGPASPTKLPPAS